MVIVGQWRRMYPIPGVSYTLTSLSDDPRGGPHWLIDETPVRAAELGNQHNGDEPAEVQPVRMTVDVNDLRILAALLQSPLDDATRAAVRGKLLMMVKSGEMTA